MVWDPAHPPDDSPVVSPPLRDNFAVLDTALIAPLTALANNQVLVKAAGPVVAGVPPGMSGWVLTLVAGVPTWAAPTGGGGGVTVVPLWLEQARFPDGTTGNLFPQPVERISTGTPSGVMPKLVELVYQFDGLTPEWLCWKLAAPMDYVASGAITLVVKWSMVAISGTKNIRVIAGIGGVVDGSSDARALTTPVPAITPDQPTPGAAGQQKETRLGLTSIGLTPGMKLVLALSLYTGSTANATSDRVLEAAWLEFAR